MIVRYLLLLQVIFFSNLANVYAENCTTVLEACIEGAEIRTVNGIQLSKPCWKYRSAQRCSTDNYDQDCVSLKSNPKCEQINSKCIDSTNSAQCSLFRNTFSCSADTGNVSSTKTAVQCGSSSYCANGQCDLPANSTESDFGKTIPQLAAINEAAKDNNKDANNLKIFSGNSQSCDKAATGYNNCCRDDGWGQDYASASCTESENLLIQQKQKKLCHYVGEYCSSKILGQCTKTTKTYCCFSSKISRVVIEQGRAQLGISWGSAENPECRGFTPEELKALHFEQMDFTEIKDDIAASITLPNTQVFEDKVKQKMKTYEKEPASN